MCSSQYLVAFSLVLNLILDDLGSFLDNFGGPASTQKAPGVVSGGLSPPPPPIPARLWPGRAAHRRRVEGGDSTTWERVLCGYFLKRLRNNDD